MVPYQLLADVILVVHALFVAFVVLGQLLVVAGVWRMWGWVRMFWFRLAHLLAIGIVVLQSWLGILCPLTAWENALRERAGQAGYGESFIGYWLHRILFYDAAGWVFVAVYSLFGALVVFTWVCAPPILPARAPTRAD